MRHVILLALILCLVFGFGCKSESAAPARPLIKVNGREIGKTEFLQAFEKTLQPGQQLTGAETQELQRTFLVQMIDQELMVREARRLGITVTPAELAAAVAEHRRDYPAEEFEALLKERGQTQAGWEAELQAGLVMEKLLEQAVYGRIEVKDTEVANYYESHREDFDRPAQVRARQIVVADEAEGRRLLGLLRQGQDFAKIAREHSLSPDAEQGGDLGFFGRDQMPPEFDAVVFSLPVGRLSDLVQSEYGFHIFRVEEKRPAARLSRQEATEEIRAILLAHKHEEAYAEWLQGLRNQAEIEIDWSQLDGQ